MLVRDALVRHIRDEQAQLRSCSAPAAEAVRRGHQDLLREIDAILTRSGGGDDECHCVMEASHLTKAIARQAALENSLYIAHDRRG